jgi:hypothetical protein
MSTASGGITGKPSVKAKTSTPCRTNSDGIEKRFKVKLKKTEYPSNHRLRHASKKLFCKEGTKIPDPSNGHQRLTVVQFVAIASVPSTGVVREMILGENYERNITPIRSDISRFSRGTAPHDECKASKVGFNQTIT